MALPKVNSADNRKFGTGFDPEASAHARAATGNTGGAPLGGMSSGDMSDPYSGVGNPLTFPEPRPSPAIIAKQDRERLEAQVAAQEFSRKLAAQKAAEQEKQDKLEEKARRDREKAEAEASRKAAQREKAEAAERKRQEKLEQQEAKRRMNETQNIARHGHSRPDESNSSANATGYDGSYTQEAAYEVSNAVKNGKLPMDDAQYLLKLLRRHYGETESQPNPVTPYGVGFDLMSEIEEQLEIVRAMKNQVFTFSGSVKPGVEFKDAKAVMDSNHKMIGTLMTHMKELVNMRALQEIEEATHKAIETLPAQFAEMFYQELAKRLKGRGK